MQYQIPVTQKIPLNRMSLDNRKCYSQYSIGLTWLIGGRARNRRTKTGARGEIEERGRACGERTKINSHYDDLIKFSHAICICLACYDFRATWICNFFERPHNHKPKWLLFYLNLETANSLSITSTENQHLIKTLCGVKEPIYLIKTEQPISIGTVWLQIYDAAAENGQSLKILHLIVIILCPTIWIGVTHFTPLD